MGMFSGKKKISFLFWLKRLRCFFSFPFPWYCKDCRSFHRITYSLGIQTYIHCKKNLISPSSLIHRRSDRQTNGQTDGGTDRHINRHPYLSLWLDDPCSLIRRRSFWHFFHHLVLSGILGCRITQFKNQMWSKFAKFAINPVQNVEFEYHMT